MVSTSNSPPDPSAQSIFARPPGAAQGVNRPNLFSVPQRPGFLTPNPGRTVRRTHSHPPATTANATQTANVAPAIGIPTPTPPAGVTMRVHGVEVAIKRNATVATNHLINKFDRQRLNPKDLREFEDALVGTKHHPKYSLAAVDIDLSDPEKLKEIVFLPNQVKATDEVLREHDVFDVFMCVLPVGNIETDPSVEMNPDTGEPLFVNLLQHYHNMTIEAVAASNYWYNVYLDNTACPYYQQNQRLTYRFLKNHCTSELTQKVLEVYNRYPATQRGGPLFFIIMIQMLVVQDEKLAQRYVKMMEELRICNVPGEDVGKVVSALRVVCTSLYSLRFLPPNAVDLVLTVYQSSSVEEFNAVFATQARTRRFESLTRSGTKGMRLKRSLLGQSTYDEQTELHEAIEVLHDAAQSLYTELKPQWTVPTETKDNTAFVNMTDRIQVCKAALLLSGVCWNCGEKGHLLHKCPKPKNEKQIEANRKAFNAAKQKQNGNGDPKSSPPKPEENNRRIIDGRPMFWQTRRQRWVPDRAAATQAEVCLPPAPAPTPSQPTASVLSRAAQTAQEFLSLADQLQQSGTF